MKPWLVFTLGCLLGLLIGTGGSVSIARARIAGAGRYTVTPLNGNIGGLLKYDPVSGSAWIYTSQNAYWRLIPAAPSAASLLGAATNN